MKMVVFSVFITTINTYQEEGMVIQEMSFPGIQTALDNVSWSIAEKNYRGLRLQNLWNDVVYQYDGSMKQARYDLPLAMEIFAESQ